MDRQKTLEFLRGFIAIESVSTDPKRLPEMERAVGFLSKKLRTLGFTVLLERSNADPPLLVAERMVDPDYPTIAVYGHYDVQPEDPVEEWESPPFRLTQRKSKLYGRGVADNKGHIVQNIAAIESLIKEKKLTHNIIFLIEGAEERGSHHFESYVKKYQKLLRRADVFFVTDMGMHDKNIPQIFYGLRGIVYFELALEIGVRDLHSGIYGNRVYNPAQIVADLLSKMKDTRSGKVLIPGFYEEVRKLDPEEKRLLSSVKRSDVAEKREAGVYEVVSLDKENPSLSSKIYPSLDVNGMVSGYTGEGSKTVIPRLASVKFSCRLVEFQKPEKIIALVRAFIKKNLPEGVKYELVIHDQAAPFYTDIKNEWVRKTSEILGRVFDHKTLVNRSGGSIPAAEVLQRLYKKPIILTGFTLPDDNIHAPNENFDEEMFWKGITALKELYGSRTIKSQTSNIKVTK